jgi:pyruvate,water dikinase
MASLAREFGVPTVLGLKGATTIIEPGTEITLDGYSCRVYRGRVDELLSIQRSKESGMKETPVFQSLRAVADKIVPLNLVNPKASNFRPENCSTLHDIMRLAHELSYLEMFKISDIVSDTNGAGAKKLSAPIPLDLHIIDLGGGFGPVSEKAHFVRVDQIVSTPLQALLKGMLRDDVRHNGAKPIDVGGFLSVMREQMFAPNNLPDRFGDRSYAIISDKYLNFSSRIGYHYSVLDCYCGESTNKNYITFSFKGGAADDVRRNRRARCIAIIFSRLGFQVETREDRVDARYYKYDQAAIIVKLDLIGRLLQFTRQMDMIMLSEASVEAIAKNFLEEKYYLSPEMLKKM